MVAPRKRTTSRKTVGKKEDVKQEVTDAKVEDVQKQDAPEPAKDVKPAETSADAEEAATGTKEEQGSAVEEAAADDAETAPQEPAQQQPAQQPVVDDEQAEATGLDINTILDDPDDDHEAKLLAASTSQDLRYASVSNVLLGHVAAHSSGAPEQSPEHTVGKLYTMERTLTAAALTQDAAERKSKLRIIELGFSSSGQVGALSYRGLVRYTELWRWGAELLETAKYEVHVFTALSGKANVKEAVSVFDETAGGAIDTAIVIPEVMANLKAHFGY